VGVGLRNIWGSTFKFGAERFKLEGTRERIMQRISERYTQACMHANNRLKLERTVGIKGKFVKVIAKVKYEINNNDYDDGDDGI